MKQKKSSPKNKSHVHVIEHPVMQHKLSLLRKKETRPAEFRRILSEISCMMAFEVTRDLKTKEVAIETPLEKTKAPLIADPVIVVSIQRAGSGMLEGMMQMLPFAKVGHVGIYRDKNIGSTVEYYFRIPNDAAGQRVILIDPLLATGDTAVAAIDRLKEYSVGPIHYVCILAAPDGIKKVQALHPDVNIFTLSVERELNKRGYILPGLGDAGDRLFDTV